MIEISIHKVKDLVIDKRARKWCELPYGKSYDDKGRIIRKRDGSIKYSHPKGCPNYNKQPECPPLSPEIEDFLDLNKKKWFIVVKFNLKDHADKLKEKHPEWSEKQARCVLYWQGSVRKQLTDACKKFIGNKSLVFTLLPEAMGVQVIKSAKKLKIPIEIKPKTFVHKIALIGFPKQSKMYETERVKCSKCRKRVDVIPKDDGELICPICSTSLGFVMIQENLFIEMVQVYLEYKGINAKAITNEDGLLDILINFDTENHQSLADLLSKCIPISYVITNTAFKKKKKGVESIAVKEVKKSKSKKRKSKKKINKDQTGLESFL